MKRVSRGGGKRIIRRSWPSDQCKTRHDKNHYNIEPHEHGWHERAPKKVSYPLIPKDIYLVDFLFGRNDKYQIT